MKIDDIKVGRWYVTRQHPGEPHLWRGRHRPSESDIRDGHGGQLVKVLGVGHYISKYGECGKRIIEPRSSTTGRKSDIEIWIEYTADYRNGLIHSGMQTLVSPRMILMPKAEYEERAKAWQAEQTRIAAALSEHEAELAALLATVEQQAGCSIERIQTWRGETKITLTLPEFKKVAPAVNGALEQYVTLAQRSRDEVTC